MFLNSDHIDDEKFICDIVVDDYRTAVIFRKYGIDYCCSGKLPLKKACEIRGLDLSMIKKELSDATRITQIHNSIDFNNWNINFLVDYLINVHHAYLTNNFHNIITTVQSFVNAHSNKQPQLKYIIDALIELRDCVIPHLEKEESVIFPYIKQIAHAYVQSEPYAALLVRTLRKPVDEMMKTEHAKIVKHLHRLRELTNDYTTTEKVCISHKVALENLRELDNDLVQHVHLEANVLFPRAISMEKEMLAAS